MSHPRPTLTACIAGLALLAGADAPAQAEPSRVTEIVPSVVFRSDAPASVGIGVTTLRHTYKWGSVTTPAPLKHLVP